MEHVLAVDLGTGGPKVALVGVDGSIVDREVGITRLILGADGAAEQDPDDWWRSITAAVRRLLARGAVPVDRIVAISVTSHWTWRLRMPSTSGRLRPMGFGMRTNARPRSL